MPSGDCFQCNMPGHWAYQCPLKTPTKITASPLPVNVPSPPVIHCPCNGGACDVLTSKTEKNPNRRFYKCPSVSSCGFFKWCDQVSIKSATLSLYPPCPCGSGPCRRVTVIDGPDAQRSYFVCCIKKGFGACEFFQWEDDSQITTESEEVGHGGSPCSTLIGFSDFDLVDDENLLPEKDLNSNANAKSSILGMVVSNDLTLSRIHREKDERSQVVDGMAQPVKDYADNLPRNAVLCSSFNNLKPVSSGVFASADGRNEEYKNDFGETKEHGLLSLAPKHKLQVEALCSDILEINGKEKSSLDILKVKSVQNTSDPVSSGTSKPGHQSTTSGENIDSFSGNFSLMNLIEQYNSEKLHFESVSKKHVDALTACTGSYKQLESLRGEAHSLKKQLFEVEKQVKFFEAETSKFASSLQEVCGEMVKSQRKMVESAGKLVKEVRVYKQRDFAVP